MRGTGLWKLCPPHETAVLLSYRSTQRVLRISGLSCSLLECSARTALLHTREIFVVVATESRSFSSFSTSDFSPCKRGKVLVFSFFFFFKQTVRFPVLKMGWKAAGAGGTSSGQ